MSVNKDGNNRRVDRRRPGKALSIFVSYTRADRPWAEWMGWQLEEAGHTVILQAWDFKPGSTFVLEMQEAISTVDCVIAVLSKSYLEADFARREWAAAFSLGVAGKLHLLPIRVEICKPGSLLADIVYLDLVGAHENLAKRELLAAVQGNRRKPLEPPSYPGP